MKDITERQLRNILAYALGYWNVDELEENTSEQITDVIKSYNKSFPNDIKRCEEWN